MSDHVRYQYESQGGDRNWPYSMDPNPSGGGTEWRMRVPYSYLPQSKHRIHSDPVIHDRPSEVFYPLRFANQAYKIHALDTSRSMVVDLANEESKIAHKIGGGHGCNLLFGDASVSFKRSGAMDKFYKDYPGASLMTQEYSKQWRVVIKDLEQAK